MSHPKNGTLPVIAIRNTVIFPGTAVPIRVGRAKSVAAVRLARAQHDGYLVAIGQIRDEPGQEARPDDLYRVGTLVKVEKVRGDDQEGYHLILRGVARFRVDELREQGEHLEAKGEVWADFLDADAKTAEALLGSLKILSKEVLELLPAETEQLQEMVEGITDLTFLSNLCAGNLEMPPEKKQELLEMASVKNRVLMLLDLMQSRKEKLTVEGEIREKLSSKLGKSQRESILREQLKTIKEELGEGGKNDPENSYRKKIEEAGMPEEVRKVALDELARLDGIGSSNPEAGMIRNYLDLLVALPWAKAATGEIDLDMARRILDQDHYGLDRVKKRILQHLAVMKLSTHAGTQPPKGSILLLVGPPGVGKTSLGQSIARALGRKFARASLGGVRDEAEIRGHRRTYIGAMAGKIISGLKRAGENNPVFLLDEVDKLSHGYSGDPAAALLEVLDPEQNSTFTDHYLDLPFDLSKVTFLATANSVEGIPAPLLDRMEVIELTGYTTAEKLHIAKNHLVPKQLTEHGLTSAHLEFSDEALMKLITHYTREAGVRSLQRKIAEVCRGSSEKVLANLRDVAGVAKAIRVEVSDLEELVGPARFEHEVANTLAPPGVVTGLAWTPVGGEILFIESSSMPGSGKLILTGQLGEVMKESAQIALTLVRSKVPAEFLRDADFEKRDIHIHVPAGAIPKDGPSAGITMLTTVASLLTGRSVSPRLAMTGEITLRGAVMPVGGIKEKVMAAHRAGIEKILLCKKNEKDLKEIPDEIRSRIQFTFVESAVDVLKHALGIEIPESAFGLERVKLETCPSPM